MIPQEVKKYIKPKMRILDLGAGSGENAHWFAMQDCQVIAVDVCKTPKELPTNVEWMQLSATDFFIMNTKNFDMIFCKNMIQFLPHRIVYTKTLPAMQNTLVTGGLIYIQTFTSPPQPNFKHWSPFCYRALEIIEHLDICEVLFTLENQERTKGLDGLTRLFFQTNILVKKR